VTWVSFDGGVQHRVTYSDFDSGNLTGDTFSWTFNKVGTFSYSCSNHPNMIGTVIVTPITPMVTVFTTPVVKITPMVTAAVPVVTLVAVPVVTPVAVPVVTPIMKTTPTETENSKVAILQVVYNISRKYNKAEVTVSLKNIGNSTARFVNLYMNIPAGLGATLDSKSEMDGNEIMWKVNGSDIVWKGDIEPGKEHVIKYQVVTPKADIEIPVKVTYINSEKTLNKVMAKASSEGVSVSAASIDPQDLQTILLVIQIAKSLTPGFEIVLAISGIGAIDIIRKVKFRL